MAQSFDTRLKHIAGYYLQLLHAKVTVTTARKNIEENPYYPSLLSLSETFEKYNIGNNAFEVSEDNFDHLEAPFVAFVHMPGTGKDFVLVTAMNDGSVSFLHKSKKRQTMVKDEFLKRYQNIIWIAEPDEHSGETGFAEKQKAEQKKGVKRIAWYTALSAIIVMAFAVNTSSVNYFAFGSILFLKLAGIATAIMLLIYETDKSNAFVRNLCSAGGHANCDAVLSSKGAKILGISWGEIGFFYFASTLLLLFFSTPFADKTFLLAAENAFAAPYILFSIYYQWRVVKQWCPLCLTVQAILFLELVWSIINFWSHPYHFSFSLSSFIAPLQGLGISIISWYALKPFFVKAKDADLYAAAYKRLQYNPDIFNDLLRQQAKAPDGWQQLGIIIGNQNAYTTIIKVCNPYCGPCAKAHPELEEIIKHNRDAQLKIIFTAKNNKNDPAAIVVKHLLAIAAKGDATKTQQSLDDWYLLEQKDYEKFALKYPMNGELKQQDGKIEAMSKWCEDAEITHTPTIFVNGHRLPENYNIEELKNFL
ncbi:MAG TPA: vitamin K epoxide reductase family protein [Puia sp.]|nr:vitamin K epoxide reductase family protein [Puia sp.]